MVCAAKPERCPEAERRGAGTRQGREQKQLAPAAAGSAGGAGHGGAGERRQNTMKLGLILVFADDFATMLAFYRDTLALPMDPGHPGPPYEPGVDWASFRTEGATLELFSRRKHWTDAPAPVQRESLALAFQVTELPEQVARLEAQGVAFSRRGEEEWGRYARFRDPEGNELQLFETRPYREEAAGGPDPPAGRLVRATPL